MTPWLPWRRARERREQRDREIAAEIQTHLELEAGEQRERGLPPVAAHDAARRAFGNVALVTEDTRAAWGWTAVEQFMQDVRYAVRTMRRSPGFAFTAILSLAMGIGVNAAMFSMADALLFRPLAIREPGGVAVIRSTSPERAFDGVSYPDFKDFRDKSQSFDGVIAHRLWMMSLAKTADAVPQMRMGMKVSRDFFQTLGVEPALGRAFLPDEVDVPGRDGVAVLSHSFWMNEFDGDPRIVGRTIYVSDTPVTIVGIAPKLFTGMDPIIQPYLYVPASLGEVGESGARGENAGSGESTSKASGGVLEQRGERGFIVRGRLRDGVTRERAQAELTGIAKGLEQQFPDTNRARSVVVRSEMQMRQEETPALFPIVILLLVLAGLVLAIVCANVANLLLARARARSREVAIRLAIGSGQFRLVRQLLTESAVMAVVGGIAGVGLGFLVTRFLGSIRIPTDTPLVFDARIDTRVLLFSLAAALLSALAFGLVPAWQAGRTDLVDALKRGDAGSGAVMRRRRMWGRQTLVVGQIALALVLMVTAGIMLDAFRKMLVVDLGFRTSRVMMLEVNTGMVNYDDDRAREFFRQLIDRTRALPGVRHATLARAIPFRPNFTDRVVVPEGYQLPAGQDGVRVPANIIDEAWFETMGAEMRRGRAFTIDDRVDARKTAIVNEMFASLYWPRQDAVGKRLRLGPAGEWVEVVGVARTTRFGQISEPPKPYLYLPLTQHLQSRLTLLVHTAGDARAMADPLRQLVRSLDSRMPVFNVRDLQGMYEDGALGSQKLIVQIVSAMGLLGLSLAIVGLYAVIAYSASRRMREFGVRISIGASRADILRLVLREGVNLSAAGVVLGLALSVPVQRALSAVLVGLGPISPWIVVIAPLGLVFVTITACVAPAWRASLVNPTTVLRLE
jgi:macrolide transport system ATP-binding/permease protein